MRLRAGILAQVYVLGILLTPVVLLVFAIVTRNWGGRGIAVFGAIAFALLLGLAKAKALNQGATASAIALLAAGAVAIAFAGTLVGGQVCTRPDRGGCRDNPRAEETSHDSDWYGWPVYWKTDLSAAEQRANDFGETLILTDANGVSFSLLIISLGVWFAMGLAVEVLAVTTWQLARSLRKPARAAPVP